MGGGSNRQGGRKKGDRGLCVSFGCCVRVVAGCVLVPSATRTELLDSPSMSKKKECPVCKKVVVSLKFILFQFQYLNLVLFHNLFLSRRLPITRTCYNTSSVFTTLETPLRSRRNVQSATRRYSQVDYRSTLRYTLENGLTSAPNVTK